MKFQERIVNALFRTLFRLFYRFDTSEFKKVPTEGPLMIIANHTSTFDGPLMYVFLRPRKMIALAKKELWDTWFLRFIMNLWNSIPVDRDNMGRETMESCFQVLKREEMLAIAPEGTRSKDGSLQSGKPGVAFIAHKGGVPIVPIAITGFEKIKENLKRFKRTPLHIAVGEVFVIKQQGGRLDSATRQQLADEIMLRLATLVPQEYRGVYANTPIEFHLTSDDRSIVSKD
ncbi:MAG: lysophospholipid acyltransferase family protein [Sphaerochaetaceae bacterium]